MNTKSLNTPFQIDHRFSPKLVFDIDVSEPIKDINLNGADTNKGYTKALGLVRLHQIPLGAIDLDLIGGKLAADVLTNQIWKEFGDQINQHLVIDQTQDREETAISVKPDTQIPAFSFSQQISHEDLPFVSVIICTHERPQSLNVCLDSFRSLDYPDFEIILVDSAPVTDVTLDVYKKLSRDIPQLRYIREKFAGLSIARNAGVSIAQGDIIAFTDDDVIVDRFWLHHLVEGFKTTDDVGCVTGLVFPAEIETQAQELMEQYGGMGKGYSKIIFDIKKRNLNNPLIPYSAGWCGVGANMAFKADILRSLRGFDNATGAGTLSFGGDDLAIFFENIIHGHKLVYNPSAIIFHYHRKNYDGFRKQVFNYGVGLTAYLTSIIFNKPALLLDVVKRIPGGIQYLLNPQSVKNRKKGKDFPKALERLERLGMLYGPVAYLRSRWKTRNFPNYYKIRNDTGKIPKLEKSIDAERYSQKLLVANLLNNLAKLSSMLLNSLAAGDMQNAFLQAAGMNQIIEDHLNPDIFALRRIGKFLEKSRNPIYKSSGKMIGMAHLLLTELYSMWPSNLRMSRIQSQLAELVQQIADAQVGYIPRDKTYLYQAAQSLIEELNRIHPGLSGEVLRLPSCFRSFDQQPADLQNMINDFSAANPDFHKPILVIGIRTSGSYLEPLCVAFLKAKGYQNVKGLTIRVNQGLRPAERKILRRIRKQSGLSLVTDDPPISGKSFIKAVQYLRHNGFSDQSIIPLIQLFQDSVTLPSGLNELPAILLPHDKWAIQQKLDPSEVQKTLEEILVPGTKIGSISRLPLSLTKQDRSHVRARYQIAGINGDTGESFTQQIFVEGVGLGYFGTHTLAIQKAIDPYLPHILGLKDGLLYREWLPEENRLSINYRKNENFFASQLALYVAERHNTLRVENDTSLKLVGTNSSWEIASNLLSRAFGRESVLAKQIFLDDITKKILTVQSPSIIDGKMDIQNWFVEPSRTNRLIKINASERDFSHLDLYSYDPVFDLAELAIGCSTASSVQRLRTAFEMYMDEIITPERWLLLQWVHIWDKYRQDENNEGDYERNMARLFQNYFSDLYFKDLNSSEIGWLCALDIDGVLETHPLGFPQLTPSSAISLRALIQHGFSPLLATGRSLEEVRERCRAYNLVGGVAEYGSAIYNHLTGSSQSLLSPEEQSQLDDVRYFLYETGNNVAIDQDYCYAVRAYQLDKDGQRKGLDATIIEKVLSKFTSPQPVNAILGKSQTDFTSLKVDKGKGLRFLLNDLTGEKGDYEKPLVFAVGDTVADFPMFSLAARVFVPGHVNSYLRKPPIKKLHGLYQAGFQQAVSMVLHHDPGDCQLCSWASRSDEQDLLLKIMGAQEENKWGMARTALQLAFQSKRS